MDLAAMQIRRAVHWLWQKQNRVRTALEILELFFQRVAGALRGTFDGCCTKELSVGSDFA